MNLNWSYGPETAKLDADLFDYYLWPLTLTFGMDVTFAICNISWNFHDDPMTGTKLKGGTDGQRDGQTDRRTEPFIELLGRS